MKNLRDLQNLGLLTQVGFILVLYIFGSLWLGNFVDQKFSTSPLFLFIFLILGLATAFYNTYRLLMKAGSKKGDEDPWKK